jgi:hypothetical protein
VPPQKRASRRSHNGEALLLSIRPITRSSAGDNQKLRERDRGGPRFRVGCGNDRGIRRRFGDLRVGSIQVPRMMRVNVGMAFGPSAVPAAMAWASARRAKVFLFRDPSGLPPVFRPGATIYPEVFEVQI